MSFSVGQVAGFAGITVRTLHHYDDIGLLSPGDRTTAGYRRYVDADLDRLQRILFYRELGFGLDDIATLLDDPGADALDHLRRQRELLAARIERLRRMVAAVDDTMEARKMGISLTPEERLEVFGDFNPEDYAEEVEERWGGTDAFEQSQRRTAQYTKADWLTIQAEGAAVEQRLIDALGAGLPPDSDEAMDAAEAHRRQISRWHYDCTYEIHTGLADMYVADERFTAYYEQRADGLAQYLHDAIHANADRASGAVLPVDRISGRRAGRRSRCRRG